MQFRHGDGRATTVPFHKGRDISPVLLRKIARDIGMTAEALLGQPEAAAAEPSPAGEDPAEPGAAPDSSGISPNKEG